MNKRIRAGALSAVVLITVGLGVCPTDPANAKAETVTTFQLQNAATGLCLDYSNSAHLRMFGCNDASYLNGYQRWYELPGHGQYQIFENGFNTSVCLYASGGAIGFGGCSSINILDLWFYVPYTGGAFQVAGTSMCMDDSSVGLRMYTCNEEVYQDWRNLQD